ncbi:MAG: hypothetical protein ABIP48_09520 [Planctomycetota bacterium]
MYRPDGEHVGVIVAHEPGEHLRRPINGTAWHVQLAGVDGESEPESIVGEGELEGRGSSPAAPLPPPSQNTRKPQPTFFLQWHVMTTTTHDLKFGAVNDLLDAFLSAPVQVDGPFPQAPLLEAFLNSQKRTKP